MKKIVLVIISCLLIMGLSGCSVPATETENEAMVYSMSGANDLFEITNGVILLGEEEEIFDGGDLKIFQEDLFLDVTSYTCSFYLVRNGEKRAILSNSTVDRTGGTIRVAGDLGSVSGNGILIGNKISAAEDLERILLFELITTNLEGQESTYQLMLTLDPIT